MYILVILIAGLVAKGLAIVLLKKKGFSIIGYLFACISGTFVGGFFVGKEFFILADILVSIPKVENMNA